MNVKGAILFQTLCRQQSGTFPRSGAATTLHPSQSVDAFFSPWMRWTEPASRSFSRVWGFSQLTDVIWDGKDGSLRREWFSNTEARSTRPAVFHPPQERILHCWLIQRSRFLKMDLYWSRLALQRLYVSTVQQNESIVHTNICPPVQTSPFRPPRSIKQSSLCSTVCYY